MKRKILVLLFVAILLTFFAMPCYARTTPGLIFGDFNLIEHEGEYIVVENEETTEDEYPVYTFSTIKQGESWALYENGVLTLHNFRSKGELRDIAGNHPHMNLTLKLEGENHTGMIAFEEPEISCIDMLIITGSGNLTINVSEECIDSRETVVIDENFTGTLNLIGKIGINGFPAYDVEINNGNVNIDATSKGVNLMDGSLIINGGNVNISGKEAGVHVECGKFNINGGNISIESSNGMAVYHNAFSGGGKMPSIKNGYLDMELTEGVRKLNAGNAKNVHSFKVNYTEPLEEQSTEQETNPVDEPADPTDPTADPTTDPVEDPDLSTENVNLYIAGGCGVLLIAIIALSIVNRKKKK